MVNASANSADVLVVGGGPAGLAAAIALRQRGASVTVADAMRPPIDKACGEGLMPDSLRELARLGVGLTARDGAEFRGIRFVNHGSGDLQGGDPVATAHFPALDSPESGVGLRRQALHTRLVERAEEAGVRLCWGSPVRLGDDGRVSVAGEAVNYGWLVGADGQASAVRRWAGLERGATLSRRFGFRRHVQVGPWSSFVEVHWSRSGQAYVTPTGPNEVCVAAVVRDARMRLDGLLAEMPLLRKRLGQGKSLDLDAGRDAERGAERGAVTTTRSFSRVTAGRVALVGDASGSADAVTGEGMGLAFRQALLLAECLSADDPARYNRLHPKILRLPQRMARLMLLMDRSEAFRRRAIGMLAAEPAIFARLLGVHLGAESIAHFVAAKGLELGWRLAWPATAVAAPQA